MPTGTKAFFKLCTRDTQLADIKGVDDVDAVLNKGAFSPAQDLVTETNLGGHIANLEISPDVGIEKLGVFADQIFSIIAQLGSFSFSIIVFRIVESRTAQEEAEVVMPEVQITGNFSEAAE